MSLPKSSSLTSFQNITEKNRHKQLFVAAYDQNYCAICHEEYTVENPALIYCCGHAFHFQCAEAWLARSRETTCCLCGVEIHGPRATKSPILSTSEEGQKYLMSRRRKKNISNNAAESAVVGGNGDDDDEVNDDNNSNGCTKENSQTLKKSSPVTMNMMMKTLGRMPKSFSSGSGGSCDSLSGSLDQYGDPRQKIENAKEVFEFVKAEDLEREKKKVRKNNESVKKSQLTKTTFVDDDEDLGHDDDDSGHNNGNNKHEDHRHHHHHHQEENNDSDEKNNLIGGTNQGLENSGSGFSTVNSKFGKVKKFFSFVKTKFCNSCCYCCFSSSTEIVVANDEEFDHVQ